MTGTGRVEAADPMPISMMFWAGPGSDAAVIKAGVGLRGGDASSQAAAGVRTAAGQAAARSDVGGQERPLERCQSQFPTSNFQLPKVPGPLAGVPGSWLLQVGS